MGGNAPPTIFGQELLKQDWLAKSLFYFAFFVDNVFTGNGIKFFDLHFFRHGFFVFGGGVEVPVAFAGNKFDFIAHCEIPLSYDAVFTHIR